MWNIPNQLSTQRELTNEQLRVQMQNTVQSVISAYYGALVQRDQLDVLEEVLTLSRDRIRYQETRLEFGQAGTFDLLQAQDAYLSDSTTWLVQLNNYENALRNLQLLMGSTTPENYVLTDNLSSIETAYSYPELEQRMLQNNPDLKPARSTKN
ncbi:MAG: TolC family protein [Saprospiraceae bacterium]